MGTVVTANCSFCWNLFICWKNHNCTLSVSVKSSNINVNYRKGEGPAAAAVTDVCSSEAIDIHRRPKITQQDGTCNWKRMRWNGAEKGFFVLSSFVSALFPPLREEEGQRQRRRQTKAGCENNILKAENAFRCHKVFLFFLDNFTEKYSNYFL